SGRDEPCTPAVYITATENASRPGRLLSSLLGPTGACGGQVGSAARRPVVTPPQRARGAGRGLDQPSAGGPQDGTGPIAGPPIVGRKVNRPGITERPRTAPWSAVRGAGHRRRRTA